jgi:molecular chaperone HscC
MIVGIDLGTTNSLVAVWRNGEAELIPNALGDKLTPSVVSLDESGRILTGMAARERLPTHPARTAANFKRYMGASRDFTLGSKTFRPEELSAFILRSLKADAEAYLGEPISQAVITVPAYFNDAQRKATKAAGQLAGLEVPRLLTEPTAAALAYGVGQPAADQMILVVDLGGGTFDVSLLHRFEGVTEVRATAGDTWLGGEDFVDVIVKAFLDSLGAKSADAITASPAARAALRRQAEIAKRRLSEADSASLSVTVRGRKIEGEVGRETFEKGAEELLARLRFPIDRALRDARVDPDLVARVILAGGASRMPMFRRMIGRIFRRLPLQTISPDEVVGLGAAVRAGMLMRDADLVETIMTDVAPFTLGTEISVDGGEDRHGDVFLPIIERNTVIPASRVERLYNAADNQTQIGVGVFQGESRFVADNIKLGNLTVTVPPAPRGQQAIDVRFTYDPSGLLEVEVHVLSTDVKQSMVIEGNPGVLSAEEIEARLLALETLKLHPRDQSENQVLMARGKRLYEERLGRERAEIGRALGAFHAALEGQNPDRMLAARTILEAVIARWDVDHRP